MRIEHRKNQGQHAGDADGRALRKNVEEADAWYLHYVEALTPAQLAETIHFTFTDGLHGSMTREEMLMHVVTHDTYHRGGVGRMIAERGLTSPPDTLTRYLRGADPRRRALP